LPSTIQRYGFFQELILRVVFLVSKFVFSGVQYHFSDGKKQRLVPEYPTVYFSNHVAETDIPGLSRVHFLFERPRIQYTIPVREDMIGKNFLVKEFKPKGFLRFVLHLIDLSGILPVLFQVVGAVGVKRPFRDNAKTLMKEGKLREQVEQDWQILAKNIESGKNVMIFPEGVFSEDGYLRSIKHGIAHLAEKRKDLSFFYFNFTYDYLSYKKPFIHIGFGEKFQISPALSKEEIAAQIKDRLGRLFTVTPANLTSFVVLNTSTFAGESREWLTKWVEKVAAMIQRQGFMYVSHTLASGKDLDLIEHIIDAMLKRKVLRLDENSKLQRGEQYENEKNGVHSKKILRERPFFYHGNQLRYYRKEILEILGIH